MNPETMSLRARLFVAFLGLCILIFVINVVRTRKLKEQYALLWLLAAGVLVVFPFGIDLFNSLAHAVGVDYPPALLFSLALMVLLLIFFQFSFSISRFSDQIKALTQDLAIANQRIHDLEERVHRRGAGSADEKETHHQGTEEAT
jgi:hypothetical protein